MERTPQLKDISSIILNNAFDAIIYYLPVRNNSNEIIDFEFVYMNDSAFRILSGNREDYIGKRFLRLFPYAEIDGMFDAFKKTAVTGNPSEEIFYYEFGEYKGWYRDSIVKHEEGIIVFFRDVTAQKLLETELENKTRELEKLLKEKELLLKETHHRIKNNLQLLASMINLQCENIDDQKSRDVLRITRQRIINMAKIHQGFYETRNYPDVKLTQLIKEISSSIVNVYPVNELKADINYDIEEVELEFNFTINICLIINELLTNAVKHAFNETSPGKINIMLKKKNDIIELTISDNGCGMPPNFNLEKSGSLGLLLVNSLVDQMGGSMEVINIRGTTFNFKIPFEEQR